MNKLRNLLQFNKYWIISLLFIIFYVYFFTNIRDYNSIYNINTSQIIGTITGYNINGNKLSLDIYGKEKLKATYYFKTEQEKINSSNICLGCTIFLEGKFTNLINNTIPNTFNYKKYLYNKKIYYSFDITNYIIKRNNNFFYKIKDYFYKRVEKQENKDYLKIFILGDKGLISSDDYQMFQENGVAHLLAISGMHIGVFLKILDFLLQKFKEKPKMIIISTILLFYAFLTNFAASIMRAVVFYILLKLKKFFNWKISNFKVLYLTATILLIFNPFLIYDVGFLYSFVITGGLILNHKYLKGNYFKQLLIISIISLLFSLPITINLNYEVNLTSIFANLIFVPLISLVIYPIALLTFVFPIFGIIFNWLITILTALNLLTNKLALFIILPKMKISLIIFYYTILIISIYRLKFLISLILILIFLKITPKLDNHYYVYYLDVNQGDSALLISPFQREIIMIDTGGKVNFQKEDWMKSTKNYQLSANTLKFIKSLGISKIDYLFLSHGDEDHAGEAPYILKNFNVKNIILNNDSYNSLEKEIIKIKKASKKVSLKDFKITNLNQKMYDNENDNSLVLNINFLKFNLLFMGDASKKVEEEIINNYKLQVDILKLGHHGSNTSSSEKFIQSCNFNYGIISSGRNNIYNHPSPETIDILKKYHKKYFNTQTSGTIGFTFGPNAYTIQTYLP